MMTSYTTVEAYGAFPQPLENCPVSQLDPYADEALIDPWEVYAELQRLGSAVWLTKYQMFALTRYDSVMRALKDASLPDGSEDEECPSHPQNNIAIFPSLPWRGRRNHRIRGRGSRPACAQC
jgi:hypothetical protein